MLGCQHETVHPPHTPAAWQQTTSGRTRGHGPGYMARTRGAVPLIETHSSEIDIRHGMPPIFDSSTPALLLAQLVAQVDGQLLLGGSTAAVELTHTHPALRGQTLHRLASQPRPGDQLRLGGAHDPGPHSVDQYRVLVSSSPTSAPGTSVWQPVRSERWAVPARRPR